MARTVQFGPVRFDVEVAEHDRFWDLVEAGGYEPAVTALLVDRLGPGRGFVDVGAWIGPYTLLAAALGSSVVAFEPDPVALAQLRANLALNPELAAGVDLRPIAVAARAGVVGLTGGSHGLGASLTRVVRSPGPNPVTAVRAGDLGREPALRNAALIKVDIEGGEFAVVPRLLKGMAGSDAALVVSLHGFALRRWAEGRGRPARLVAARSLGGWRRARLVWAARHHRLSRATGDGWQRLGRRGLPGFCLRLAEVDLLLEPVG